MAKVFFNQREHLVIQMNIQEATNCGFGIEVTALLNVCICDVCNNTCDDEEMYYVAGINDILCKECMEDFVENTNHYMDYDSLKYEVNHFNYVAERLNMKERAALTPNGKCVLYDHTKIKPGNNPYT